MRITSKWILGVLAFALMLFAIGCSKKIQEERRAYDRRAGGERIRHIGMFEDLSQQIPGVDSERWTTNSSSGGD